MTEPEAEELFAQTITGDYESEGAWNAVHALRQNGSREIFEDAAAWCLSDQPLKRARAAAILCQLRRSPETRMFQEEAYLLITKMLEGEQDPLVLDSCIFALGHLDNPSAIPVILPYQSHGNENVRFAVAFALGCFPNDAHSVAGLSKLTTDRNAEVRDWAVFGLGVLGQADSPEIRSVLLRCLDDPHEDVREEAAVGLGKRRDERVIPKLLTMLEGPGIKARVAEAVTALLGFDQDPPEWAARDYRAALLEMGINSSKSSIQ